MELSNLIDDRPGDGVFRVHRSAMTSQEIFDLERRLVFDRSWLYVGHETELAEPGDYRRRTVNGRPLIFIRGSDGKVRVLNNSCRHRGAQVCRLDQGQAKSFQCFYHAWTYDNKGDLVALPDEEGYASGFDKRQYGLKSPPRVEEYRGLYFVSFDEDIADIGTYLGPVREVIDLTMDSAEALGGWYVIRGTAKYSIKANWKLLVENSYDGYHLLPVHKTFLDYVSWRRGLTGEKVADSGAPLVSRSFAVPHGHGGMLHQAPGRAIANPSPLWTQEVNDEVVRIRAENIKRFGELRGRQMSEVSRHVMIFPNLAFQDSQTGFRLRQFFPVTHELMDVTQWDLVPRNERADLRASRMENSLAFLGPGGLATPDDVEALESCQEGFAAGDEWSDISRGMQREPKMTDELQMRSFWRQWHALMQKKKEIVLTDDRRRDGSLFLDLGAADGENENVIPQSALS